MQRNHLLASLPRKSYRDLLPGLAAVKLVFGDVLYENGDRIREVYFPGKSVVSLLTVVDGRNALEVGLVGPEGMVGIPLALGMPTSPVRALVQGAGDAMRMSTASFRKAYEANPPLRRELHRYTHALMAQITQTAACNRFHVVEARLARWLLMTRDRVRADELPMTQDTLARMLGVHRPTISVAAEALRERGLIAYKRGRIVIGDREGLVAASCEHYAEFRTAYEELLGPAPTEPGRLDHGAG